MRMYVPEVRTRRGQFAAVALAVAGLLVITAAPTPPGLRVDAKFALATTVFAAILWVTRALPLAVTALSIPAVLTGLGVYPRVDPALAGFADPLIFLFVAGFMLANALQKHAIDRRVALWIVSRVGASPRLLVLAIMIATAFLSMWVSNTATTAMMTPVAMGILAEVVGRDHGEFSNMRIATLLGTAYAASVGGVGTLIGTPPNAVVVAALGAALDYHLTFTDWLAIGLPVVVVTLPVVWYLLVFRLYPPEVEDVAGAREEARRSLSAEGTLSPEARRVVYIFAATATLWVVGGLGDLFAPLLPPGWATTLFGGSTGSVLGQGHQGLLHYVLVGIYAIPLLALFGGMDVDELVDIDWGTILLFGGGLSLADALAATGATGFVATRVLGTLVHAPLVAVVATVVLFVILLTELTSNTATTSILAPILIGLGGILAGTLGVDRTAAAVFLSVSGAIAASFAFSLPVATPPNAIVFGSGHMDQRHMLRAGMLLNVVMTLVLTGLISLLFYLVWPAILW